MKILVALTVLCLASFALCSHVVELTPDNFDQYVDGSKYVFVKFYAPWSVPLGLITLIILLT